MPFFSSIKSAHSSIKVQLLRSADGKPTTAYRVYVEEVCTMRGKKIRPGDVVAFNGQTLTVTYES